MARVATQLAKLSKPRLFNAISRDRLFRMLDEARRHPVIWVAGSPGAGKTTLLASYCDSTGCDSVWYQCDAGDRDPATFFYYLRQCTMRQHKSKDVLPLFTAEYRADLRGFSRRFFQIFFSALKPGALIVLDNSQEALEEAQLETIYSEAAEQIPDGFNLFVLSRTAPPLSFARNMTIGRIHALPSESLKFTSEEVRALAVHRYRLPADSIIGLEESLDGWAAGITLALERLRDSGSARPTGESMSREAAFEYFASEIFDRLPFAAQSTLSTISLLPSITPVLAAAMTGDPEAGDLLESLYRRHFFTYRQSGTEPRYQFHALFRDFLSSKLISNTNEAARAAIYDHVAEFAQQSGNMEPAFTLRCRAGNWHAAAGLIRAEAPSMLGQGRGPTLTAWIQQLPDAQVAADPWIGYWLGAERSQSNLAQGRMLLVPVYGQFQACGDRIGQLLSAALITRTIYYEFNDFASLDRWITILCDLLQDNSAFPDATAEAQVYSALLVAMSVRQPAHPMLGQCIVRLEAVLDQSLDVNLELEVAKSLLACFSYAADFDRARPLIRRIEPRMSNPDLTALSKSWWWLFLGYHLHVRADDQPSRYALDQADQISKTHGLEHTKFLSHIFRVYQHRCAGDLRGAERHLEGAEDSLNSSQPMQRAQFHLGMAGNAVLRGNGTTAADHARLAIDCIIPVGSRVHQVMWHLVCAQGLLSGGFTGEAEALLNSTWPLTEGSYLEVYRAELLMLEALCARIRGHNAKQIDLLRQCFVQARVRGGDCFLRWVLEQRSELFGDAVRAQIDPPYVAGLIRKFRIPCTDPSLEAWPWPVKVRTLGTFQIIIEDEPISFSHKVPRKPLALLRAIIASGGSDVPAHWLTDALWGDESADVAMENLRIAIHRLRKLLVFPETIQWNDGLLTLDRQRCWVDIWALDTAVNAQTGGDRAAMPDQDPLLAIYKGPFLPGDDAPWALSMREKLRSRFVEYVARKALYFEREGKYEQASGYFRRGIQTDDLVESFYQGLMRCQIHLGQPAEGIATFRRLRQTLSVTLGIQPSPASHSILERLQQI
jgi:DNA-binding SARP family transcriptional activator